ncbi:MAG: sugar kinase [Burkholderiales bacterium]|nr:sugar kinase [Burkholderiales bacterium]
MKPILCVGACAWTTLFRVGHLPRGSAKIMPDEALQIGDGMSASAACAAVRLGGRAEFWARVGDDANGRAAIASLTEAGLDCRAVRFVPGVKGSFCTVIVDGDGERVVVPRHDPGLPDDPSWLPVDRIAKGEFAAVLTEVRWPAGAAAVLDAARNAGLPAILDAEIGAPGVLDDLAARATHVLYSETGLAAHVGNAHGALTVGEQLARAQALLPHALVGVTRGAEGFYWLDGDGALQRAEGVAVNAVDTLAAGDVFHGAYAQALAEAMTPAQAGRFAAVAASLKCETFGGRRGAPDRAAVLARLA